MRSAQEMQAAEAELMRLEDEMDKIHNELILPLKKAHAELAAKSEAEGMLHSAKYQRRRLQVRDDGTFFRRNFA